MKKLLFATALMLAINLLFCQPQQTNNTNNNGGDDCQCIGKGIQAYGTSTPPPIPPAHILLKTSSGSPTPEQGKTQGSDHDLWYYYFELYLSELRNSVYTRKGN